mmetsp:Transcript_11075/g.12222  ORF Transcript_11075/g.12222 Transcript_11075/m.12222 type:complete len:221 (+) Transcript_11075:11-673(+)
MSKGNSYSYQQDDIAYRHTTMTASIKQIATYRSRFIPFFLIVLLVITVVYGNDENTTLLPSSAPSSITASTVSSYNCGDYSTAEILTYNIMKGRNNNDTNWTAIFKARERPPFQFLKAGISCDHSDRMIFDNDHNERNNVKDMTWKYNITENGSENVSMVNRMGDGDGETRTRLVICHRKKVTMKLVLKLRIIFIFISMQSMTIWNLNIKVLLRILYHPK